MRGSISIVAALSLLVSTTALAAGSSGEYPDGSWQLQPPSTAEGDWFGGSVAMHGDYVLVGQPSNQYHQDNLGSAHLYQWNQAQDTYDLVWSPGEGTHYSFGECVAMTSEWMAISAPYEPVDGFTAGVVYIYMPDGGGGWNLAYAIEGGFGFGKTLLIVDSLLFAGNPFHGGVGTNSGKVDMYLMYPDQAVLWLEVEPDVPEAYANFGEAIGFHEKGNDSTLVVGAPTTHIEPLEDGGRVYIFKFDAQDGWVEDQVIFPNGGWFDSSNFGCSVSIDGDRLAIGHRWGIQDSGYADGTVELWAREQGSAFTFEHQFSEHEGTHGSLFGDAVVLEGTTLVAGCPGDDEQGGDAGAAYVYELDAEGEWILERKLLPHFGIPGEQFGACLAFEGDRLIVGTWAWLGEGIPGSAWAYDRSDGSWQDDVPLVPSQIQTPDSYAFAPDITTPSYFGFDLVASGSHALTTSGLQGDQDAAHFLLQGSDSWEVVQSFEPHEAITPIFFGFSSAIDGGLAAVGDPYGVDTTGAQSGVVHIYERDESSEQWEFAGLLNGQFMGGEGAGFGSSLALQSDTETIVVGGVGYNDSDGGVLVLRPGAIVVLDPPVSGLRTKFGRDVSLHGDLLAVSEGEEREDGSPNEVHIFRIEETGEVTLLQSIPDPRPSNGLNTTPFGFRMEMIPGGLLVGSPSAEDEIDQVGVVYFFIDNGSGFKLEQVLASGTPAPGNNFGAYLVADDDLLVVGEIGADDLAYNSGVNWVFELVEQEDGSSSWVRCAKLIDPLGTSDSLSAFPALSGDSVLVGNIGGTGAAPNTGNISVFNDIRRSYWTGPPSGNWSDEANWTPIPPDNARASVFSSWPGGFQAVTLDELTLHVPQFRVELTQLELDISSGLHYLGNDSSDHLVVKGASSMGDTSVTFDGFGTFLVRGDILVGDDTKLGRLVAASESAIAAMSTWRQGSLGRVEYILEDYIPSYAAFASNNAPRLAGTLAVRNPGDVEVKLGDTYNIFSSNEVDGPLETRFDIVSLPGLAPGLVFRLHYGADAGRGTETIVSIEVEEFNSLVGFQEPDSYDIQDGAATDVVTIDLTGDGADEIAVCVSGPGGSPGQLYVFINDGMGGFASQDIYPLGSEPASIAAGDFEGDGWIDLAVSNYQDDEVRIFRNDADGSGMLTEDTTPLAVGVGPLGIAAKDFNHDGADDLIVCCSEDRAIEIYEGLNIRNRSRAPSQKVTTPGKPQDVDPEDVVKPKFGNVGATTNDPDEIITMNVGTDGSLADPVGYPSGDNPGPITSEDVDGDGNSDFVATNQDDGSVTVLKQSAGRGYDPPIMLPLGATAGSLTIVDIEGDGDQDIVAVVDDGDGPVAKLLRNDMNLYNGELLVFADAEPLQTDVDPVLVDSGDLDQDGFADLVTIGESNQRSRGGAPSTMETHPNQRCSGDVNGDNKVDVNDLLRVILDWGDCPSTDCPSDLNLDGMVGLDDLLIVVKSWGNCDSR